MSRLWIFLAIALPVIASVVAPMSTVDLAYHLRAGDEILSTMSVPSVDTWTFTAAGETWVDQQWGAQAIFAVVHGLASWTGIVLLRAALTGFIFGGLAWIVLRRGVPPRHAALLVIAAFCVAAPAMALRPQLIGMACFTVMLLLISVRRAHPNVFWLAPITVMVWANMHGSFVLGPVLLGLAWFEDVYDGTAGHLRTLGVAVASIVAAFVNPFGPAVWIYAFSLAADPQITSQISEWQPPSIREASSVAFFASVAAVGVLVARRGSATPWPTLALLAVFVAIGLFAVRGIAWWPLVATVAVAPMLVPSAAAAGSTVSRSQRRLNLVVAGTLVVVGALLLPLWRPVDPATNLPVGILADAPPGLTAALREVARPGDRILNDQAWGSWFEYAVPNAAYAVDSRIELFSAETWRRYETFVSGSEGWADTIGHWAPDIIVLERPSSVVVEGLVEGGWSLVRHDDDGVLLVAP